MAETPNATALAPTGATAGTEQSTGTQPGDAGQATGTTPGAPEIDWNKVDWQAHADKIPWDKLEKRIEQLPNVRKMQSTYERRMKELERQSRQEAETLRQQLTQYQQLIAGQEPELASKLQGIHQQGETLRLQQQLEYYQEVEGRKAIAEKYDIPEDVVMGFQGGLNDVLLQAMDYQRLQRVEKTSTLEQQLADMQKKIDALTRQRSDPAANADVNVAQPSGSHFQTEWERLVKEGRSDEAWRVRMDAKSKGVEINTKAMKPPGWA